MINSLELVNDINTIEENLFSSLDSALITERKRLHDLFIGHCFNACPWVESISFSLERQYNDQGGYYSVDFGDSFCVDILCVGDKESLSFWAENGKVEDCPEFGRMPNGDDLCKQFDATFSKLLSKLNANILALLFGLDGEITISRDGIQSSKGNISLKKALDVLTSGSEY